MSAVTHLSFGTQKSMYWYGCPFPSILIVENLLNPTHENGSSSENSCSLIWPVVTPNLNKKTRFVPVLLICSNRRDVIFNRRHKNFRFKKLQRKVGFCMRRGTNSQLTRGHHSNFPDSTFHTMVLCE